MLLYALILFAVSAMFLIFGILIYRGKTDLIHSYHQENVTDQAAYGKDFGRVMLVMGAAPFLSGILSLLGESDRIAFASVAVLMIGLLIGIVLLCIVQKKHNGGFF